MNDIDDEILKLFNLCTEANEGDVTAVHKIATILKTNNYALDDLCSLAANSNYKDVRREAISELSVILNDADFTRHDAAWWGLWKATISESSHPAVTDADEKEDIYKSLLAFAEKNQNSYPAPQKLFGLVNDIKNATQDEATKTLALHVAQHIESRFLGGKFVAAVTDSKGANGGPQLGGKKTDPRNPPSDSWLNNLSDN